MDVFLHVTRNGGATMETLETGHEKHSDNHALWIDPNDGGGNHLLVGTRYETLQVYLNNMRNSSGHFNSALVISYFFFVLLFTWAANRLNKDKA